MKKIQKLWNTSRTILFSAEFKNRGNKRTRVGERLLYSKHDAGNNKEKN